MRISAALRSSRTAKLALVPAVGVAVFAFATSAHAGNTIVDPPPLPSEDTSFATDVVAVRDPVVAAPAIEPTGDGSAIAAATVIEQSAPSPAAVEMPANKAVAIEADPIPKATDLAPSAVIPPADVTSKTEAPVRSAPPATRQYHAPAEQYQPAPTADAQAPRNRPEEHPAKRRPKPRNTAPRVSHQASKLVQIMSRICTDIDLGNLVSSDANDTSNATWNVGRIGACIVDLTSVDPLLQGVDAPSPCSPDTQYQPAGGQYQTDVATCPSSSPAPAVSAPTGPAGGPELGASVPAFPASPISPPVIAAATIAAPQTVGPEPRAPHVAHSAPTVRAEHVLAATAERALPASQDVFRPEPRIRRLVNQRPAHVAIPHPAGPRTRIEALRAQPERVASSAPSHSGTSAWLAAAGLLFLFGLASMASAVVGTVGTNRRAALRQLGLRASSRGLSKDPLGRGVRRQRGIRYRD